ncbi:MAG: DUF3006 domain-containing protein [Clostridia bacterium]|nr:DUF3006 domain-containing protein [Clostridia bacterium]
MRKITVDRIEESFAVCEEDGETVVLPMSDLPQDTEEGSILVMTESGWSVDREQTQERRNALFDLQNSLFDQ